MSTLILTTERTYLREFNNLDIEALTLLLADPDVNPPKHKTPKLPFLII
jgi:hypothetical protein